MARDAEDHAPARYASLYDVFAGVVTAPRDTIACERVFAVLSSGMLPFPSDVPTTR